MRTDKTYSELWNISDYNDETVRETVKMAIRTLDKLQEENRDLRLKISEIKSFIKNV